jgi:hypothetical protein
MSAEHNEHHDKPATAPAEAGHGAETGIVATLKKIYLWGKRRIAEVLDGGDAHGHGHGHGAHGAEGHGHDAKHDAKHEPAANDNHGKDDHGKKDDHHKKAA